MDELVKEKLAKSNDYSADSIQVLEGLEAVRKRPAMYIGDISAKGLHHLVYEVVVSCVNALSSHLQVIVHGEGKISTQEYSCGKPLYPVKVIGETDRTGTEVT